MENIFSYVKMDIPVLHDFPYPCFAILWDFVWPFFSWFINIQERDWMTLLSVCVVVLIVLNEVIFLYFEGILMEGMIISYSLVLLP
jgi:hypothetical protein